MLPVNGDTIVVGLDTSDSSQDALRWALDEAERSKRRVLIVHVWHWSTDALASPTALLGLPDSHKTGRALLRSAKVQATVRGVDATTRLLEGSAAQQLTAVAADAAMLVVGSHGHGVVGKMMLGSVSSGCVQHAACPVVVVPPRREAAHRPAARGAAQPVGS